MKNKASANPSGHQTGVVASQAAVLAFEMPGAAEVPEWVQIFPLGEIVAVDGRAFRLTDPAGVVDRINAMTRRPMVDYDHRSTFQPYDGGDQLAAGWLVQAQVREGGIWARIEWTPAAATKIRDREYRYVSPEFMADPNTGEVFSLVALALVNRPAFLMAALAAEQRKEPLMKQIAAALGLPEDATETQILAAIGERNTQLAAARTPAPDAYMPRADYDRVLARAATAEAEVASVRMAARDAEVGALIDAAVTEGKIAPASREHYVALASSSDTGFAQVKALCASLPPVLKDADLPAKPLGQTGKLTDMERETASALGISEEDFLKHRATA